MDKLTVGLVVGLIAFLAGFFLGLPIRMDQEKTINQSQEAQQKAEKAEQRYLSELRKLEAQKAETSKKLAQAKSNFEQSKIALREAYEARNKVIPQKKSQAQIEKEQREQMLAASRKEQEQFHWERQKFYKRYLGAANEAAQSTIFREAGEYTYDFFRERANAIKNWEGKIENIDTPHGGDTASVSISAKIWDLEIIFKTGRKTKLRRETKVFNQLLTLPEGTPVLFSTEVLSDDREKGILETSWTEKGNLRQPAFIVEFTDFQQRKEKVK